MSGVNLCLFWIYSTSTRVQTVQPLQQPPFHHSSRSHLSLFFSFLFCLLSFLSSQVWFEFYYFCPSFPPHNRSKAPPVLPVSLQAGLSHPPIPVHRSPRVKQTVILPPGVAIRTVSPAPLFAPSQPLHIVLFWTILVRDQGPEGLLIATCLGCPCGEVLPQ